VPEPQELTDGTEYLLEWFYQLNSRRQPGFNSPAPITYQEIDCWARRKRLIIYPDEIDVLTALDTAFLNALSELRQNEKDSK